MAKDGIKAINGLPDEIKQRIIEKYGSLEKYYTLLYKHGSDYYNAFVSKDEAGKAKYEDLRFVLAHELEDYGVIDGLDIVDEVWGDFDEDLLTSKY